MRSEHAITQLCAALEVTRSGYHHWQQSAPSGRAVADAALSQQVAAIHAEHRGRYGSPRITRELRAQGQPCGRKRVARLLRQQGLRGLTPRGFVPRTTQSEHDQPIAPNRLKEAPVPTGPNQVWVHDLTYVKTEEGWIYVAVILDLWSRKVVGWAAGESLRAGLVLAALAMALRHRRPAAGLLHHSDRGVQYACGEYRAALGAAGIQAT